MQPSTPKRLVIPKLGVDAPVRTVGLDAKGAIETPPSDNANLVGWYQFGPTAGESGPAVMLGHKDTLTRSAVFSRLHELRYGDVIEVSRMDGTVAVFTVGGVEQAAKETFPTNRVYGAADRPELRLITCGGVYNRGTGHYQDNVIVYATMTSVRVDP
jgi:sortase (surface protein transpeptidase)